MIVRWVHVQGLNRKMINKFDGPYRIAQVLNNDRFVITAVKGTRATKISEALLLLTH